MNPHSILPRLKSPQAVLREWSGELTADLVREPAKFGLGQVPVASSPDGVAGSVCGFCSTGCNLTLHLRDGEAVSLTPDSCYPVNLGMACPKGWESLTPLDSPDRAVAPLFREGGRLVETGWDKALGIFVDRMKAVQERHGKASVAYISTGQIVTEEMALLGALAKFGMGMRHGDGNTRQCMATAVAAYKESFGFDAPPFTYADFEESDVLVFVGANPCIAHPILWQRVMRNTRNPDIVVIDPRRTETACAATLHVPLLPKSDLVLLYGLAREIFLRGAVDRQTVSGYTEGMVEFESFVQDYPEAHVLEETGLPAPEFRRLAGLLASGRRISFWWTMGVNQGHQATRTAQAIINLALITGNIGRPGSGANSITGQCNAMGSRLFSNTTNLLGGHDFTNPVHREKVAGVLGLDESRIPQANSWAYDQILEGVESGAIKALWIIATNPAHSWIHQNRFRALRDKLEFLVVQDMYASTETAQAADLFLPAAGWGEKTGTFINSERRFGVIRQVRRAPGRALSDFRIFQAIAQAWGCGDLFARWDSPESVFQIMKDLSAGQPCDITGIRDYAHLEEEGGIQWPFPREMAMAGPETPARPATERRLFGDRVFFRQGGKARLCFETPRSAPELPDAEYPFWLLTGRGSSAQWHTETRTGKSPILRKLYAPGPRVEIHPGDAEHLGIRTGDEVEVVSRRGSARARAVVSPVVAAGQVFLPMHDVHTNRLTYWVVDPLSRQPAYKCGAVYIKK